MPDGKKRYIDPAQKELNNKYKIDETIRKMKAQGRWPNPPSSDDEVDSVKDVIRDIIEKDVDGELSELLEKADQKTLDEVYRNIINDFNQSKNS